MFIDRRIRLLVVASLAVPTLAAGCGEKTTPPRITLNDAQGEVTVHGDVWADNWFALYLGEDLLTEDSVSITTERSFNAESFAF